MKLTTVKNVITDKISGEWGDETLDGQGVIVIRTANFLNTGLINFSNLVRREIDQKKVEKKRLISGDIIIEKSGGSPTQPVGRVVIFRNPDNDTYLCNNFTSILRPNRNKVHPEYLFYVLYDNHKKGKTLRYQNKTTGIINLKLDRYLDSEIPLPPLEDQKRIAHLLGKVEGLIARRKQHLQQLDDLLKSVFLEMFGDPVRNEKGWEKKALPEICYKITDGEHLNPRFSLDGMPIVMAGNVLDNTVNIREAKRVEFSLGASFRRKCNPEHSDILLVSRGATIGRLCKVDTVEPFCLMGSVILIKPNHEIVNASYLTNLLKLPALYLRLFNSSGSSAQQAIYLKDVKRLICTRPPIDLQNQFAAIVEKVESLKSRYEESLADLETLYGALSQKAFKGELDLSRVPLPVEEFEQAVIEDVKTKIETDIEENHQRAPLSELVALTFAEGRKALLDQLLPTWLDQLGDTPFSAQHFMTHVEQRAADLIDAQDSAARFIEQEDVQFGPVEYDHLKTRVFESIEQGRLTQGYDDANNRVQVIAAKG